MIARNAFILSGLVDLTVHPNKSCQINYCFSSSFSFFVREYVGMSTYQVGMALRLADLIFYLLLFLEQANK